MCDGVGILYLMACNAFHGCQMGSGMCEDTLPDTTYHLVIDRYSLI